MLTSWITPSAVLVFARQGPKAPGNRGGGQFTEGSLSAETGACSGYPRGSRNIGSSGSRGVSSSLLGDPQPSPEETKKEDGAPTPQGLSGGRFAQARHSLWSTVPLAPSIFGRLRNKSKHEGRSKLDARLRAWLGFETNSRARSMVSKLDRLSNQNSAKPFDPRCHGNTAQVVGVATLQTTQCTRPHYIGVLFNSDGPLGRSRFRCCQ